MTAGRILVIDDTLQNRALLEAQLEAAGYVTTLAASGEEGLAAFDQAPFDLVLLDVMMPGINGIETCRRLRLHPRGRDIPILFLTASHESAVHDQALDSGGDDFLRKPIERTELLLRVRSLIRITRLQSDLRRERDALVKLQEQKDLLTALLVHDLKNPLSSVIANSQFVLDGLEDEDQRSALEDVSSSAETIHQMVLNLLDIGRAEDGVLVPAQDRVDLKGLFEELARHCARRLVARRQQLRIPESFPPPILADAGLLTRTLQNLLDNSMKYSPSGTDIVAEIEGRGSMLQIRIRDHGAGIPVAQRERIFEKYAQVEGRTLERSSRGLGLVFCRLAAEAHRGKIWVEDNVPKGSTFVLELPVAAGEQ